MLRSAWSGIVLALVVAGLLALAGKWSTTALIAVLILVLLGAVFPPAAFVVGGVAVFYLLVTQGLPIAAKIQSDLHPQGG